MFQLNIDRDVSIRLFNDRDADELFQLVMNSREYLREWLGWLDFTQRVEDSAAFINETLKALVDTGGYPKSAAITYKDAIAGTIGFNEINKFHKIGIIGYWLGEGFQGKGIMTKACRALTNYGFKTAGLNRIEIRVAEGNLKSKAIPKRLGFTEEGKIRQAEWLYDHYVDHILYGMLAEEWENK
ncbi:ribosomal-protein-serine acetyltransferase [Peribacillus deserti]|uniref:Ribosomal-protein-serine acetyltransferase n=1 Tax=Peribacillus deserti TaxID=673318 RepID=A0ABS2QGE7_9BACI|nr:GNAT family protein [Peribacillus deserti]MBM7692100.1 ribosomal-protein-serine acetyltransferase [Peribacillus deserti]